MTHDEAEEKMNEMLAEGEHAHDAMQRFVACKARGEGIGLGKVFYPGDTTRPKRRKRRAKVTDPGPSACRPIAITKEGEIHDDWEEGVDYMHLPDKILSQEETDRLVECIRTGKKVPKDWRR